MGWVFIHKQQEDFDQDIRDRATLLAGTLARELATQTQLLAVVADSPRLDLPVTRSSFEETAQRLTAQVPSWQQLRVSDTDGNVDLAYPPLSPTASRTVVDRASHDRVLHDGKAVIGDVVVGPRGVAAFAVRVPITRGGRIKAVLTAVIRPQFITDFVAASGTPSDWSAWVVDSKDQLVASTRTNELAGKPVTEFARPYGPANVRLPDGTELHVAPAQVAGTSWAVEVGVPLSVYSQGARKAIRLLVGGSVVALLLSAFFCVLLQREMRARAISRESVTNWQRMDALGKLTGQVAHDFNNLLMVFQSGISGIKRRPEDAARVAKLLDGMGEGVERGKALTRRLLSFARRSNQGAQHLELDRKLAEWAPLLKHALNDTITIDIRISAATWPVKVDPSGLEIAIINLLTNAREAMDEGGEITVTARNVPDASTEDRRLRGAMVALTISDRGRGVAAEDISRVFEPFFSTKNGTRPGLGLTQVLGFAETSGGTAKLSTIVGRGSAVTLFLPISGVIDSFDNASSHVPNLDIVLIVDDMQTSLDSLRLILEDAGIKVRTATSGSEALDVLRDNPQISAVITDVMMPGMSGIELAEKITVKNPGLPVVLVTGYSERLEAGAKLSWPVVSKPFQYAELINALGAASASTPDFKNVVALNRPKR
jgi:signal transduction histidine kinase/CheY-like chemotaxis protein